jgi:hypothetical protein
MIGKLNFLMSLFVKWNVGEIDLGSGFRIALILSKVKEKKKNNHGLVT